MTFQQLLWIHAGGLAILLGVFTVALRGLSLRHFSTSFAAGYVAFIAMAALLFFASPKDAQAELYWLIPAIVTLPASLLLFIVKPCSAIGVAIALFILGTIQYWGIGLLIDWLVTKRIKTANKGLEATGDPLRGSPAPQP